MNDFKVGDKVIIKSWEQMCNEFTHNDYMIDCHAAFLDDMKYLCGREVVIKEIEDTVDGHKRIQDIDNWTISFNMITYPEGYIVPNILVQFTIEELQAEIDKRKSK